MTERIDHEPEPAGNETADRPRQLGFVLLPQFSMISLAAAIDPLRMANRLAGRRLYEWPLYCPGDEAVTASNEMVFRPTRSFGDGEGLSALFVVAGYDAALLDCTALTQWLRQLARTGVILRGHLHRQPAARAGRPAAGPPLYHPLGERRQPARGIPKGAGDQRALRGRSQPADLFGGCRRAGHDARPYCPGSR
ncbi:MAG: hypothetical protein U5L11_04805 [Arhodomonas sp.]|nr:hypothetical protein [Arhodomonas sp.]